MPFEEIKKSAYAPKSKPNLADYSKTRHGFDWFRDAFSKMDWLPGGGLNNAYEAVDRHVAHGHGDRLAMIWAGKNGEDERYTYAQFKQESDKFGAVLNGLGIERGDRVMIFVDRLPETYFASMGALKAGGVIAPLFSAFGPDPVRDRMADCEAKFLVTTPELRRKISGIFKDLPKLRHIIVVNKNGRSKEPLAKGDLSYEELVSKADASKFQLTNTTQFDFAIMHYTSGSTGKPKGVMHRHQAVVQQWITGRWCLDLKPEDVYWCTADPGWVTGTSYGMMAPWTNGVTQLIYEGGLSAGRWYDLIDKHKVTVWYTAPTAIRMLMRSGSSPASASRSTRRPSSGAPRTTRCPSTTTGGRRRPGRSCAPTTPAWTSGPVRWAGRSQALRWESLMTHTTRSAPVSPACSPCAPAGRR